MGEHTFENEARRARADAPARTRAIELAERLVDAVSSARADWASVAAMALQLEAFARELAAAESAKKTLGSGP